MTDTAAVDTTYRRFAADPAYVQANTAFVRSLPLAGVRRILDLCGGSGAVGQLLLAQAPGARLRAVDLDPVQIGLAETAYAALGHGVVRSQDFDVPFAAGTHASGASGASGIDSPPAVTLTVGSATELLFPASAFDCAVIANAIHLIADKPGLVGGIARVLQPGGLLAFSTGFYAGCWPPLTQQVYHEWLKEATAWILQHNADRVAAGQPALRRVRGARGQLAPVAYQNRWLTVDEWRELLAACGFADVQVRERAVLFDAESLASVGAYSGLAEAQLAGWPAELASQALARTADAALAGAGVAAVQHHWLEVHARRC